MKFLAILSAAATVGLAHGQASLCTDPICDVPLDVSCADFFNNSYVWSGDNYCCAFTEVDGLCYLLTNSLGCQYDQKSKYECDPDNCAMVGPAFIASDNSTEACPPTDFEIPATSDVGSEGPSMGMGGGDSAADTTAETTNSSGTTDETTLGDSEPSAGNDTPPGDSAPSGSTAFFSVSTMSVIAAGASSMALIVQAIL